MTQTKNLQRHTRKYDNESSSNHGVSSTAKILQAIQQTNVKVCKNKRILRPHTSRPTVKFLKMGTIDDRQMNNAKEEA